MYKGAVYYLKHYSNSDLVSKFLPGWLDGHVYRARPWDSTHLGWAGQRQSWNMASLPYCTARDFHRHTFSSLLRLRSQTLQAQCTNVPTDESGQYLGPRTRASSFPCKLMTRRKNKQREPQKQTGLRTFRTY